MEKKTIGQFIAALRKANGMTQKELAEKLNVSDKAVSRWERDENAPDLSLIPVIAEIFGVTSDEILRGERAAAKSPDGTHYYEWIENVKDELMNRDDISGEEVNVSESTDTSQEENYVELKDSSGKVLCKYRERNYSVAGIQYGEEENGYLPITVLTNQAINAQSEFMNNVVTPIFLLIYGLEAFAGVLSYRSYKRKLA